MEQLTDIKIHWDVKGNQDIFFHIMNSVEHWFNFALLDVTEKSN
jgi:hypothetical protein